jgi:hypothetical protein
LEKRLRFFRRPPHPPLPRGDHPHLPRLISRQIGKTNGSGLTSWYWQPSASLRRKGWHPRALGTGGALDAIPDDVADAARKLNEEVDGSAALPRPSSAASSGR